MSKAFFSFHQPAPLPHLLKKQKNKIDGPCQVRIKPKIRMLGEAPVHADGVWKLQNDSTKEMTAQVSSISRWDVVPTIFLA